MTTPFAALIFDCDGVLVNSEEVAQRVELTCLAEVGLNYQREEFARRFSGLSTALFRHAILNEYAERVGQMPPNGFFDRMFARVVAAYQTELEAIAGACEFAVAWQKPKAVASSGSPDLIATKLSKAGLEGVFGDYVFCSGDLPPKPSPDVFLLAAEKLGVACRDCLVIEDSVSGVLAGKAAGMTVAGFVGGGHCSQTHGELLLDNGADWISHTFTDIAQRVA